mmetsp:Transcript_60227/g.119454  ORF Transcript_60227/g.119454 Transcript_60227/m.119454 type:complete len:204 (-) Transcript_60227:215-826(-)
MLFLARPRLPAPRPLDRQCGRLRSSNLLLSQRASSPWAKHHQGPTCMRGKVLLGATWRRKPKSAKKRSVRRRMSFQNQSGPSWTLRSWRNLAIDQATSRRKMPKLMTAVLERRQMLLPQRNRRLAEWTPRWAHGNIPAHAQSQILEVRAAPQRLMTPSTRHARHRQTMTTCHCCKPSVSLAGRRDHTCQWSTSRQPVLETCLH